jgi:hypothetical protein
MLRKSSQLKEHLLQSEAMDLWFAGARQNMVGTAAVSNHN